MCGEKVEFILPDNMPLPPAEPRKRSRVVVAKRRLTIAPTPQAKVEARSEDEDDEPTRDDVKISSSRSSVESETSDTSLTEFRNRQKAMADSAASSSKA